MLGTGFLVGDGSKLITAGHVVSAAGAEVGLQVVNGEWRSVGLVNRKFHPTLDICICDTQLAAPQGSWLNVFSTPQHASCNYQVWGYPDDVVYDHGSLSAEGLTLQCPDLVFSSGHIRRRFSGSIPAIKGSQFYELSQVAGNGCSGAPVIAHQAKSWAVIGIYAGERTIISTEKAIKEIGYATRLDGMVDWLKGHGIAVP